MTGDTGLGPAGDDATACLQRLRAGSLGAEELLCRCLDRLRQREHLVQAWAFVDEAGALARARQLDALPASSRGALHGLPLGVKDVFLTRAMPTEYHSAIYRGHQGGSDAAAVALAAGAGALLLGKTSTVEFASIGAIPPTRNPHDPARTPGGSSSGSAAAVADGHALLSLGTQTAGSVIRPASYCGVFAMKPTWGRISTHGVKPFAPSLDTVGWFARSARDLRLLLDVFDEAAPEPPHEGGARECAGARGAAHARVLRLGVCRTPFWAQTEPATRAVFEAAVTALGNCSDIEIVPVALDELLAAATDAQHLLMHAEGRVSFLPEFRQHAALLHPAIVEMVASSGRVDAAQWRQAGDTAAELRRRFDQAAHGFDAILAPSTPGEAPLIGASTGSYRLNAMWTLLHAPCINLPCRPPGGMLPVGLTLTGARHADRRVLAAAEALDRAKARIPLYLRQPR